MKLAKFLPILSEPFLFRCSLLLLKSALGLMFLCIMKSNLASLDLLESSSLTSKALLLKLLFRGTIPYILTVGVCSYVFL